MAEPSDVQRRLIAVFAADVEGYSRLMGADEVGTLQALTERRAILDKAIVDHRGRIANTAGDSVLAEFASAVDAVQCAVEAQAVLAEANASLTPEKRINFRIGIHVGDVMVRAGDLFGDGVNIAARLQTIAPPGGVCVSGATYDHVKKIVPIAFSDLGVQRVKNIDEAIRAFATTATDQPSAQPSAAAKTERHRKASIAVLPFQNMSGDQAQEYFADGVVEDIITNLSKFREFHVIARNSTFAYKGSAIDLAKIGRELKTDYVVEGSVRSTSGRVRITAQLINIETGAHVWAERYDRALTDIFDLQDEITARIATAVDPAVRAFEMQSAIRKHPASLDAWDHVLRGLWHVNQFKKDANAEGRRELKAAIEQDKKYALAYAWLAMTHVFDAWFNWTDSHAASLYEAQQAVTKAISFDDAEPMSHGANAVACFWSGRMEQARAAGDRALSLNPNSFLANFVCGGSRNYLGQGEAAIPYHLKALDLSPNDPQLMICLGSLAHTHFNLGQYEEAIRNADRAIVQRHGYLFGRVVRAAALARAGRLREAREAVEVILEIAPDFSIARLDHYPFVLSAQKQNLLDSLALAGLSTSPLTTTPSSALALPLPDRPSIAVLPFQNMSGDPEQEYFADGMVEEIITALSRFKSLFVIARNSSFTYKGKTPDIRQVGRELGVRYVLEGSVRKAGGRVRITGQLIDTAGGAHLWADHFEGSLENIFELQDQVASGVVGAVDPRIWDAEISRTSRKPVTDLDAYDCFLRAMDHGHRWTTEDAEAALRLLYRAIELDPTYAEAYALATWTFVLRSGVRVLSPDECREAGRLAREAARLGKDDGFSLAWAGHTIAAICGKFEEGAALIDRALELNPNLARSWGFSGWVRIWLDQPDVAVEHLERAMRLSPMDPAYHALETGVASAHMRAGRYDEASDWAKRALQRLPTVGSVYILALSRAAAGDIEEARRAAQRMLQIEPRSRISTWVSRPYISAERRARYTELLRLAGLPE